MAHWGGSGPGGFKCRDCAHFVTGRSATIASHGWCRKYQELMKPVTRPVKFPAWAPSCKYFEGRK